MVLFDGEGAPSPAPPRGDCHHGPVYGMTPVKGGIWAAPRAGLSGDITCTAPASGRGRSAGGTGGVRREENRIRVRFPGFAPFPGYLHEIPRSCAGALWKGRYGSPRRGGGSLICANLTSLMQYIKEIDARS